MMDQTQLVSVIVCAYNAGSYLRDAIASVLNQSYRNLEIIVVDDGSTDGSVASAQTLLSDARIRWLSQKNAGKPAAMNFALSHARGEFYVSQDADDLSHPMRVERLVEALRTNPDAAAAFSGHELIMDGKHIAPITRGKGVEECRADIARMAMPGHDPTAMYRMSMVRDFQYDPALPVVEGYDYILRVGEQLPMVVVGDCLYSYRVHVGSITHADPERRERLVMEVLRRACERRRIDFEQWQAARAARRKSERPRADNGVAAHFIMSVQDQRAAGQMWSAVKCGLACARLQPFDSHYYKALVYSVAPLRLHPYFKSST